MPLTKILDELSKYGLTESQAKVYHAITRLGETPVPPIAKELHVHRAEIYRVLRELGEKGIIKERKGRPILFTALPPEEALKTLLKQQQKKTEYLRRRLPKLVDWLNAEAKPRKAKPSVLLIDDDESIRRTLADALRMNGFEVDTASDGKQALRKSRRRRYSLALVDIRLPDVKGTKLLRTLKTENPEIKNIVITGYPSIQNAMEAINQGVDAYVTKPFKPSELVSTMRRKLAEQANPIS